MLKIKSVIVPRNIARGSHRILIAFEIIRSTPEQSQTLMPQIPFLIDSPFCCWLTTDCFSFPSNTCFANI